jgi:hypothetical protein
MKARRSGSVQVHAAYVPAWQLFLEKAMKTGFLRGFEGGATGF